MLGAPLGGRRIGAASAHQLAAHEQPDGLVPGVLVARRHVACGATRERGVILRQEGGGVTWGGEGGANKYHGTGTYTWPNGTSYAGQWVDNMCAPAPRARARGDGGAAAGC